MYLVAGKRKGRSSESIVSGKKMWSCKIAIKITRYNMGNSSHSFNVEDAKEYGVDQAVILYNFRHWLSKNKADKRNIHEGRVWTYNTADDFTEIFPYWSASQIRRRLSNLEDAGILVVAHFNKHDYDRTKWYSIDEAQYRGLNESEPNSRNREMEVTESSDAINETVITIPDINTHNKPDNICDEAFELLQFIEDSVPELLQWDKPLQLGQAHKLLDDYEFNKEHIESKLLDMPDYSYSSVYRTVLKWLKGDRQKGWDQKYEQQHNQASAYKAFS